MIFGARAGPPCLIDECAQSLEQFRHAMDFIEYDKAVFVAFEEEARSASLSRSSRLSRSR